MSALLYRAVQSDSRLKKLEEPGTFRAKKGTVRWRSNHGRIVSELLSTDARLLTL